MHAVVVHVCTCPVSQLPVVAWGKKAGLYIFLYIPTNEKVPYIYIRRIHRILGVFKFYERSRPSPSISCGEAKHSPFPLSAGPISLVVACPTCSQRGSTAADPPPPKGQRPLTPFGLLLDPKISAEVLPLSDIDAKEDLSRTPQGCPGPPRQVPNDPNAQKCYKKQ